MTEKTAEVVAEVAEEVADQADHVAEISRAIDPKDLRLLLIGGAVGVVGGAIVGGLFLNRRLRLKYEQISETEIEDMREHFRARTIAQEPKPDLDEVTKLAEREGYSAPNTGDGPPVTEREDREVAENPEDKRALKVVEELDELQEQNVFEDVDTSKDAQEGWDYEAEVDKRRPDHPYVIHVDERKERDYTEVTLTYYAGDEVLCNEDDTVIDDPEKIIGTTLIDDKFGHGSNDKNIVYIRNDDMGLEVEVVKNDGSYAEVVHGLEHSDEPRSRRRKRRFDDEPDRQ